MLFMISIVDDYLFRVLRVRLLLIVDHAVFSFPPVMASSPSSSSIPDVPEPFPIFKLAHRFLLYDAATISYIRAKYNISGVLIGSLPQAPQQNVFLGIPLELMPEEARLLIEKNVAYVVDDVKEHKSNFLANNLDPEERKAFQAALRKQGQAAAEHVNKRTEERKKAALQKKVDDGDWNDIPEDMLKPRTGASGNNTKKKKTRDIKSSLAGTPADSGAEDSEGLLFSGPSDSTRADSDQSKAGSSVSRPSVAAASETYAFTPTTSYPPLSLSQPAAATTPIGTDLALPAVPNSYPLYRHMHSQGYFLAPGLRFGCQYMAYPGDPLRFHSHFLCNGMDWDEEFDLLDIVGGGRLGTGVKKGFLIGGQESGDAHNDGATPSDAGLGVRTFSTQIPLLDPADLEIADDPTDDNLDLGVDTHEAVQAHLAGHVGDEDDAVLADAVVQQDAYGHERGAARAHLRVEQHDALVVGDVGRKTEEVQLGLAGAEVGLNEQPAGAGVRDHALEPGLEARTAAEQYDRGDLAAQPQTRVRVLSAVTRDVRQERIVAEPGLERFFDQHHDQAVKVEDEVFPVDIGVHDQRVDAAHLVGVRHDLHIAG
nr:putative trna-splicing endonuclease subunit tsp-4 [Quercus suber]